MGLTTICIFTFCTSVLENVDYQSYNLEMKHENLGYENDLMLHNLTYLLDAVEFNIKVRIESAIRDTIVAATHVALDKIYAQDGAAKRQGKEVESCTLKSKRQVQGAARQAISDLNPCLHQLENEYMELYTDTKKAKSNAEVLGQKLSSLRETCQKESADDESSCFEHSVNELTREQTASQYVHDKLYALYDIVQKLMPTALKCIEDREKDVSQELNDILKQSYACVSGL